MIPVQVFLRDLFLHRLGLDLGTPIPALSTTILLLPCEYYVDVGTLAGPEGEDLVFSMESLAQAAVALVKQCGVRACLLNDNVHSFSAAARAQLSSDFVELSLQSAIPVTLDEVRLGVGTATAVESTNEIGSFLLRFSSFEHAASVLAKGVYLASGWYPVSLRSSPVNFLPSHWTVHFFDGNRPNPTNVAASLSDLASRLTRTELTVCRELFKWAKLHRLLDDRRHCRIGRVLSPGSKVDINEFCIILMYGLFRLESTGTADELERAWLTFFCGQPSGYQFGEEVIHVGSTQTKQQLIDWRSPSQIGILIAKQHLRGGIVLPRNHRLQRAAAGQKAGGGKMSQSVCDVCGHRSSATVCSSACSARLDVRDRCRGAFEEAVDIEQCRKLAIAVQRRSHVLGRVDPDPEPPFRYVRLVLGKTDE